MLHRSIDVKDLPDGFDIADEPIHQKISIQGTISTAKEFDPDVYEDYWKKIAAAEEKRDIESKVERFLKVYIYVRSVMSFYELWPRKELLNKTQINDWNYAAMKGHSLDRALLKHKNLKLCKLFHLISNLSSICNKLFIYSAFIIFILL